MLKNQKTRLIIYGLLGALLLGKYLVSPDKTAEELYPKYAASPSKFMELDGRKIHYRDEGEGEVIVLITEQEHLCILGKLGQKNCVKIIGLYA